MPIIEVTLLEGRSQATKLRVMQALTDAAIGVLDVKPEFVRVMIREIPPQNFSVGGVLKEPPRDAMRPLVSANEER